MVRESARDQDETGLSSLPLRMYSQTENINLFICFFRSSNSSSLLQSIFSVLYERLVVLRLIFELPIIGTILPLAELRYLVSCVENAGSLVSSSMSTGISASSSTLRVEPVMPVIPFRPPFHPHSMGKDFSEQRNINGRTELSLFLLLSSSLLTCSMLERVRRQSPLVSCTRM